MYSNSLPLDKSWAIRMIFLDMVYGKKTKFKIISELKKEKNLSDDIKAALDCAEVYIKGGRTYKVRNSATVCRFLLYLIDDLEEINIIKNKQLNFRVIGNKKHMKSLPIQELLQLGTTQFASAALLFGAKKIANLPEKCRLSILAREIYLKNMGRWVPKIDKVIKRQVDHFIKGGKFEPLISEDYCYARVFDFISKKEGESKWPELKNHESNRLEVMEDALKNISGIVDVHKDHRVAMAISLKQKSLGLPIRINDRKCVDKSWPQFWEWFFKLE